MSNLRVVWNANFIHCTNPSKEAMALPSVWSLRDTLLPYTPRCSPDTSFELMSPAHLKTEICVIPIPECQTWSSKKVYFSQVELWSKVSQGQSSEDLFDHELHKSLQGTRVKAGQINTYHLCACHAGHSLSKCISRGRTTLLEKARVVCIGHTWQNFILLHQESTYTLQHFPSKFLSLVPDSLNKENFSIRKSLSPNAWHELMPFK